MSDQQAGTSAAASVSDSRQAIIARLFAPVPGLDARQPRLPVPADDHERQKWLASGAHPVVQDALATATEYGSRFPKGPALGKSAVTVMRVQLALRSMQVAAERALVLNEGDVESRRLPLLSSSEQGGVTPEYTMAINQISPYFGISPVSDRELSKKLQASPHLEAGDIDEWIISNERYARALLTVDSEVYAEHAMSLAGKTNHPPPQTDARLAANEAMWKSWLLKLDSPAAAILFGAANGTAHAVQRPKQLSGLCLLGQKRQETLRVRTLKSFKTQWNAMSGGVLAGLDWNNVFVAGGIVMGVLAGSFDAKEKKTYDDSDIDLYIYGLSAQDATAKLLHIEEVLSRNLSAVYAKKATQKSGQPNPNEPAYGVLRNSKTVTLIPQYPHRRVQIILKICANPMEVLLNFDLDQVAMGFDGSDVWMLPRAARALQTGYSTFTTDLIQGHFLNDRRATQDQRVFKYASRGFGIRFLPAYVAKVAAARPAEWVDPAKPVEPFKANEHGRSIYEDDWQREMREEFEGEMEDYGMEYGSDDDEDEVEEMEYVVGKQPESLLHVLIEDARSKMDWHAAVSYSEPWSPYEQDYSIKSHASINCKAMRDPDVGSSCLSGYEQFARHVALHELDLDGVQRVKSDFTQDAYEEDPVAYYDGPEYKWDKNFTLSGLQKATEKHGAVDMSRFYDALRQIGALPQTSVPAAHEEDGHADKRRKVIADNLAPRPWLQRAIYSNNVRESLESKLVTYVYAPESFLEVARAVLPASETQLQNAVKTSAMSTLKYTGYGTTYWELDFSWQLVDRLQDEVVEMLHAFRRANANFARELEWRERDAVRQISRRVPRPTREAELNAFAGWATKPCAKYEGNRKLDEDWFMLQLPTYVTARRFTAPVKCLAQLCEAEGMEPSDMFPEWWTSKRWWRASLRKRKGKKLPYYTGEGATR